jgi:hypothetical protein
MADIELGRMAPVDAVPTEVVPELEHVSLQKVGEVRAEVTPDMEQTTRAPVGEVPVDAVADLEQTKLAEREWTPDETGPVLCRACRTPQGDPNSIFCQNCGYRLPIRPVREAVFVIPEGASVPTTKAGEPEPVRCLACGSKTPPGDLCRQCGVPLRSLSA